VRSGYGEDGGILTSRFPWLLWIGLSQEIPHSCLEYCVGVTGSKKDLVQPNLWLGGTWKSLTWFVFAYG